MKESQCSAKTKLKMALALKELIKEMPYEKITVSDITDRCDIHRQTFYYHFQDKYELLEWYLHRELFSPLVQDFSFDNVYFKINDFLTTMYNEKEFYLNVLKINKGEIIDYISKLVRGGLRDLIAELAKSKNITVPQGRSGVVFSEFFGYGMAGIVISWANGGMTRTPDELTNDIIYLIETCKRIQFDGILKEKGLI